MFRRTAMTFALVTLAWGAAPVSGQAGHAPHPVPAFAGAREVAFTSQMVEMTWTLDLTQQDGHLVGTTETEMGTIPVEGFQEGSEVEFTIYVEAPDHAVELDFTGTMDGHEASGVVDIMGELFDWHATQVRPPAPK